MSQKLRIVRVAVFAAALALAGMSPARAQTYAHEDLMLFKEKCAQCHNMTRIFKASSPIHEGELVEIVNEMQEKAARKKGKEPISDQEKDIIIGLFEAGPHEALKAEMERIDPALFAPEKRGAKTMKDKADGANREAGRADGYGSAMDMREDVAEEEDEEAAVELIEKIHGPWQLAAFLLLGLYMLFSGLSRKFKRNILVAFDFKKHAGRGKIYIPAVLLGYLGGLCIWWLEGMDPGDAIIHFQVGTAIAVLFALGGVIGLNLASGRATGLKWLHMTCNGLASVLFIFQIVTGLSLLLG